MGLDITYCSNIKNINVVLDENDEDYDSKQDDAYDNSCFRAWNEYFPYQFGDLVHKAYYDGSDCGDLCAGSYSGYGSWRRQLSNIVGYESIEYVWNDFNNQIRKQKLYKLSDVEYKLSPFYELLWFSDCEGTICSSVCKKLYKDFLEYDEKAIKEDKYFYKKYKEWTEAFRVASDNGAVSFH